MALISEVAWLVNPKRWNICMPTVDWASLGHLTTKLHHSSVAEAACRLRNRFYATKDNKVKGIKGGRINHIESQFAQFELQSNEIISFELRTSKRLLYFRCIHWEILVILETTNSICKGCQLNNHGSSESTSLKSVHTSSRLLPVLMFCLIQEM